jgi:serpin B
MKKNGMVIVLIACFWIIILLASCKSTSKDNNSVEKDNDNSPVNIVRIDAKELLSPYEEGQDQVAIAATKRIAEGANDFAFRLSAALLENADDKNFVCSPFSVWLPLAALANATNAQNKAALLAAMGAVGMNETNVNRTASRMLYSLTKSQNKGSREYYNPLKIANAIFVDNKVTLRNEFAQTFMDFFRGSSINVDFSSKDAVDAVNQWASDNTDGLIKEVVQEFDPDIIAAIANAIYFSDKWVQEFDSGKTKEDIFYTPSGESKAFYMLREGRSQAGYYEDDRIQAIPLRFTQGGGMYILLPKAGGASEFLASMTKDYFMEIQRKGQLGNGKLLLPRFSIDTSIDNLKEALIKLGVPLFDKDSAPLTGGLVKEDVRVWVESATQKAVINVDEKGTTAAAVTVMGIAATGMPLEGIPFEMICNRPFVFILYENTYDNGVQVLFTGVVNQP